MAAILSCESASMLSLLGSFSGSPSLNLWGRSSYHSILCFFSWLSSWNDWIFICAVYSLTVCLPHQTMSSIREETVLVTTDKRHQRKERTFLGTTMVPRYSECLINIFRINKKCICCKFLIYTSGKISKQVGSCVLTALVVFISFFRRNFHTRQRSKMLCLWGTLASCLSQQ